MLPLSNDHIGACERLLAEALIELARDLRMVDAADIVAWVRGGRFGNIASIVGSAIELGFRPGVMRFALSGGVDLSWLGRLGVHLDMEFHHDGVDCYFRLHVSEAHAGVAITWLSVDGAPCRSAAGRDRFTAALASARCQDCRLSPAARLSRLDERKPGANEPA